MVELEIDPADAGRMLLASDQTTFRSEDGGDRWRPVARSPGARYAWPAAETLFRADGVGTISVSADGGDTWRPVGRVEGEPARLKALDPRYLYVALKTGAILEFARRRAALEAALPTVSQRLDGLGPRAAAARSVGLPAARV